MCAKRDASVSAEANAPWRTSFRAPFSRAVARRSASAKARVASVASKDSVAAH
jgi:hypothetical protein